MRAHSFRKWKDIMRFEIRFFPRDWVKPFGINPISRKKYLISNLIICFRFPRACVRNYTMLALLYKCQHTSKIPIFYFCTLLEGGGGGPKILYWENPPFSLTIRGVGWVDQMKKWGFSVTCGRLNLTFCVKDLAVHKILLQYYYHSQNKLQPKHSWKVSWLSNQKTHSSS